MKDSGIEWIGKIPEDWEIVKLRNLGVFTSSGIDKLIKPQEPLVRIINYTDVYGNKSLLLNNKNYMVVSASEEKIKKHTVNEGDLLFTPSSETVEDIGVSAVVNEPLPNTAFSYHLLRFQFYRDVNKKYKKYLCNNYYVQNVFSSKAIGSIRKTLNRNDFKELLVLLPPLEEQQKIANFLDQKVAQIDHIIEKTKESIEEYKKYKQSLITETVTKGLNPDVEMKDSGIEWIGEIPKHWETKKLKHLFFIHKEIAGQEGYDILSVTQSGLRIKDISSNEGQMAADYSKYQIVRKGDFVMNHMDLLTGGVDCSIYNGVTSPDYRVFKLRNKEKHSSQYYKYYFQMCYSNKIFYGLGQGVSKLGRWRLQTNQFINFEIPIPPKNEQELISNYLNTKCEHIGSLVAQKEQLITEFESYKKSLVYEYVTGKKQVV